MCNFGGSSTNTNQIIRGPAYNREKLSPYSETDLLPAVDNTLTPKKPKTNKTKLTTSDTYQG